MKAIRKRHEPQQRCRLQHLLRLIAEKAKIDLDKEAVRAKLDECSAKMVKPYEARIKK